MELGGYRIGILVQGHPGKTACHGLLGWSAIVLLPRPWAGGVGRCRLVRPPRHLARPPRSMWPDPQDVIDVLLAHAHRDHSVNWTMFAQARVAIGSAELEWAMQQPWGLTSVPEPSIRELNDWPTPWRLDDGGRRCRASPPIWRRAVRRHRGVKRISQRCGSGSEETMRRSFLRPLAATPQDDRTRFSS